MPARPLQRVLKHLRKTVLQSDLRGLTDAELLNAFVAHRVEAVLHYSRRSARAFLEAARAGGVEISALALPQCCISSAVAAVLRDAGATQVTAAAQADENALFEALDRTLGRALRPRPGSNL